MTKDTELAAVEQVDRDAIFYQVAHLTNPAAEPFAVLKIDTSVRVDDGVRGTVMSLHWDITNAEVAAVELALKELK